MKIQLTPEEKAMLTSAVAMLLADGYNKTIRKIPNRKEFDKVMLEVVNEILYIQSRAGRPISVIGAGLIMLMPDPGHPIDDNYRNLVKSALVWYLLQKVPDVAKELGLDKFDLDKRKN